MRTKKNIIETKIIDVITCDICGKNSHYIYNNIKKCEICQKDVCYDCAIKIDSLYDSNLLKPNCFSDYPEFICKKCWDKGKDVKEQIEILKENFDKKLNDFIENWKKIK